ncbi:MAG: RluA family pseudouridine synthase [Clostridia bacterium]|nr:RluA family pseudouridine synthase [Clostridia bacterium]
MTVEPLDRSAELQDDADAENDTVRLSVDSADVGERIDRFVSEKEDCSRALAVKLIENGSITVCGKATVKNYKLRMGDLVQIVYPEPTCDEALPEDIPLDVVYEDGDIIVINKPKGMIVHPATGIYTGTLVNALLYHCKDSLSGIGGVIRPGIVHRIDKDTSGLLVVAKNDEAHLCLSEQLKTHEVSRVYHAIAIGNIKEDKGTVDRPIGRHPADRKKMAVVTDPARQAREAITHFEVMERFEIPTGRFTYVKCKLETGRTHQIRVHLSSVGHPLMGDLVYGGGNTKFEASSKELISGQCLHAKELELTHPRTGEKMRFSTELPREFTELLEKLRKQSF